MYMLPRSLRGTRSAQPILQSAVLLYLQYLLPLLLLCVVAILCVRKRLPRERPDGRRVTKYRTTVAASAHITLERGGEPREVVDLAHELLVQQQLGKLLVFRAQYLV